MSLQVNLSSKDIATAYQAVVDGGDVNWMLLTYDKGSNDLKVVLLLSSRARNSSCYRYKARVPEDWKN